MKTGQRYCFLYQDRRLFFIFNLNFYIIVKMIATDWSIDGYLFRYLLFSNPCRRARHCYVAQATLDTTLTKLGLRCARVERSKCSSNINKCLMYSRSLIIIKLMT